MNILRVLDPEALESAEVIAVTQLCEQLFEDRPVSVARSGAELTFKVSLQVILDMVVVEQRVVDVDQKNNWIR